MSALTGILQIFFGLILLTIMAFTLGPLVEWLVDRTFPLLFGNAKKSWQKARDEKLQKVLEMIQKQPLTQIMYVNFSSLPTPTDEQEVKNCVCRLVEQYY